MRCLALALPIVALLLCQGNAVAQEAAPVEDITVLQQVSLDLLARSLPSGISPGRCSDRCLPAVGVFLLQWKAHLQGEVARHLAEIETIKAQLTGVQVGGSWQVTWYGVAFPGETCGSQLQEAGSGMAVCLALMLPKQLRSWTQCLVLNVRLVPFAGAGSEQQAHNWK